jgi:hypothetical protein
MMALAAGREVSHPRIGSVTVVDGVLRINNVAADALVLPSCALFDGRWRMDSVAQFLRSMHEDLGVAAD